MVKAVIFDLDGTLLYTLDSIALSTNKVLEANGLPPVTHEQLKRFVGDGVIDLLKRSFAAGGAAKEANEAHVAQFRACFREDCDYHVAPYEGIPELLAFLEEAGMRAACNTNKPHENAVKLIKKHFGTHIATVQGNVPELPKKPDAAGVNVIVKALGCAAEEAVYVGDSDVDIFTARNAGCRSIGAAWGYRGEEELKKAGADFIAYNPTDIIEILICK